MSVVLRRLLAIAMLVIGVNASGSATVAAPHIAPEILPLDDDLDGNYRVAWFYEGVGSVTGYTLQRCDGAGNNCVSIYNGLQRGFNEQNRPYGRVCFQVSARVNGNPTEFSFPECMTVRTYEGQPIAVTYAPSTLVNARQSAQLTVKNIGGLAWGDDTWLAPVNPRDPASHPLHDSTTWTSVSRIRASGFVSPADLAVFQFGLKSPAIPGNHRLDMNLIQEGVLWFEVPSDGQINIPVQVIGIPEWQDVPANDVDGNYLLSWSAASNASYGYALEERNFPAQDWARLLGGDLNSGLVTQFAITGKPIGTWCYRVTSNNHLGLTSWSPEHCVTVGPIPPTSTPTSTTTPTPTSVGATPTATRPVKPACTQSTVGECRVFLPGIVHIIDPYFPSQTELEPNNTAQQANGPLRSGGTYQGRPNDNKDYWFVDLPANASLTIEITNHTGGDLQLQVFRDGQADVIYAPSPGTTFMRSASNLPAGRYLIYFNVGSGWNSALYSLRVTYPY